jgi:hypothetical protein
MSKKTIFFVVLGLLVLANAGIFVYFSMQNKEKELQTALIAQQQEQEKIEEQKKQAEKQEIEDIKKGLDKTIGGRIESIDQGEKSFVIDLDPLGSHQRYTILTSDNTEFKMIYVDAKIVDPEAEALGAAERVEEKNFEIEFDRLETGAEAQIEFDKRIDINNKKPLTASKVRIIYHKIFE